MIKNVIGMTVEKLKAEMDKALQFPGMPNIWWMPIQTRTEMLATGIRSALGIKVFGDDLEAIESTAVAIEAAIQKVPGTRSAFAERTMGGYFLDLVIDREVDTTGYIACDSHIHTYTYSGCGSSSTASASVSCPGRPVG